MNDATLQAFRDIADQMAGPEPRTWQWNGPFMSQQHYGITRTKAEALAAKHGGTARECVPGFLAQPEGGAQ